MFRTIYICFAMFVFPLSSHAATILQFDSSPSSFIGQGESRFITPDNGYMFSVINNFDNGLSFGVRRDGPTHSGPLHDHWSLDLSAPGDVLLQVGLYEDATRWPFQDITNPGLNFTGNHRGSNRLSGFFEVLEIMYGTTGQLERLAVDFTQFSEELIDRQITGSLRFNSNIPVVPLPAAFWLFLTGIMVLSRLRKAS